MIKRFTEWLSLALHKCELRYVGIYSADGGGSFKELFCCPFPGCGLSHVQEIPRSHVSYDLKNRKWVHSQEMYDRDDIERFGEEWQNES